jgi:hypothetical protein
MLISRDREKMQRGGAPDYVFYGTSIVWKLECGIVTGQYVYRYVYCSL